MELVVDGNGHAAPRLSEVVLNEVLALDYHARLLGQVVLMLCAGVVHGDLSEYNILVDQHGPVIIDLPQAVDAAGNLGAQAMLERDVQNLANFFSPHAPQLAHSQFGKEIWQLYQAGLLQPDTVLTGIVAAPKHAVDVAAILEDIELARLEAEAEAQAKLMRQLQ
jgi:RIO kinase 1